MKVIIIWIICGILGFGIAYGDFQARFPGGPRKHLGFATFIGLTGPFGLISILLMSDFAENGFKYPGMGEAQ